MEKEVRLGPDEAGSARAIQEAIDALGAGGGRVVLPAIEIELDRGIELRSGVELAGAGPQTVLRKAPGRVYPLSGYHNYGMFDVPLVYTDGLAPGMTVAIRDDRRGGFYETFARVTWVDDGWVGIDTGLHSDYGAAERPVLVTAFPLVYGLEAEDVGLRDLTLDGNRAAQPEGIGACRGAAVYFLRSRRITISGVSEHSFRGEGLGFQMCSRLTIRDCACCGNEGNGFHPGAGSTAVLFDRCTGEGNGAAGFFFCVRATRITVRECRFTGNTACGVSIGTRDNHNLIERCRIEENRGPGVLFRATERPVETQTVRVTGCRITGNAHESGLGQIEIQGDARDLLLDHNRINGSPGREAAGISVAPTAEHVWVAGNSVHDCFPGVAGVAKRWDEGRPPLDCGLESARPQHMRHLEPQTIASAGAHGPQPTPYAP